MDIDIQGARQFVAAYPESVLVFLLPPSAEVLLGRLTGRQTESPEAVHRRLTGARAISGAKVAASPRKNTVSSRSAASVT